MAIIKKAIEKVPMVLGLSMTIPPYQRPYKWDVRLVGQLISDLQRHQIKSAYRLGTLVFYRNHNMQPLEVVDGQQRLITLSLLAYYLDASKPPSLLSQPITNTISQVNIQNNFRLIQQRLGSLTKDERFTLKQFLAEKCEWVVIELNDISEAFQFFDSQNARGKELEPYDLLKAYHLREMDDTTETERLACVERWEKEVESGKLKEVMDNYLYRIRRWLRGQSGREFIKAEVDIFKGVTLGKTAPYQYLQSYRVNDHFTRAYAADPIRGVDHQKAIYPFQINQVMINGLRFFEYVDHYIGLKKHLAEHPPETLHPLYNLLNTYDGHERTGDRYARNLFDCAMLWYYDKFGNHELDKASTLAFAWAYSMRLTQHAVKLATMDNKALEFGNLFAVIQNSIHPWEVGNTLVPKLDPADIRGTKTEKLQNYMQEKGYLEHA